MRWGSTGWAWRVACFIFILWLVIVALLAPSPTSSSSSNDADSLSLRLKRAMRDLQDLQHQNNKIRGMLSAFTKDIGDLSVKGAGPVGNKEQLELELQEARRLLTEAGGVGPLHDGSADGGVMIPTTSFEVTRRRVERDAREMWWYMQGQLNDLKSKLSRFPEYKTQIDRVLEDGSEHMRVMHHDMHSLSQQDGLGTWREQEAQKLSALVQARLHALQNPKDCKSARKLTCSLNKGCGYGCQIHHVVYCLIMAYGTKRTLILKSKGWRYNRAGWDDVFLPISETCTDTGGVWSVHWPGQNSSQVVDLPIIDTMAHRPNYLPPAVPRDLSDRIIRLHGNPSAWWIGQLLKFILRPQAKIRDMLDSMSESMNFQRPIVGVHVRRTDKVGTEAAYHSLAEYMKHVDQYYQQLSLTHSNVVKRVYIASDDPTVIEDARKQYPEYELLGDPNIARTAAVATRYTDSSLKGIIADIHFLSLTDHLVCTFSSQVCRLAYEIMQTLHPDASSYFFSLDDIFYYGGQSAHNQKARFKHEPRSGSNEMSIHKDDMIGIAGNHWDGFSKGVNKRTLQNALYPSFKAEDVVEIGDCPPYEEVKL